MRQIVSAAGYDETMRLEVPHTAEGQFFFPGADSKLVYKAKEFYVSTYVIKRNRVQKTAE